MCCTNHNLIEQLGSWIFVGKSISRNYIQPTSHMHGSLWARLKSPNLLSKILLNRFQSFCLSCFYMLFNQHTIIAKLLLICNKSPILSTMLLIPNKKILKNKEKFYPWKTTWCTINASIHTQKPNNTCHMLNNGKIHHV